MKSFDDHFCEGLSIVFVIILILFYIVIANKVSNSDGIYDDSDISIDNASDDTVGDEYYGINIGDETYLIKNKSNWITVQQDGNYININTDDDKDIYLQYSDSEVSVDDTTGIINYYNDLGIMNRDDIGKFTKDNKDKGYISTKCIGKDTYAVYALEDIGLDNYLSINYRYNGHIDNANDLEPYIKKIIV